MHTICLCVGVSVSVCVCVYVYERGKGVPALFAYMKKIGFFGTAITCGK